MKLTYIKDGHRNDVELDLTKSDSSAISGKNMIQMTIAGDDELDINIDNPDEIETFQQLIKNLSV